MRLFLAKRPEIPRYEVHLVLKIHRRIVKSISDSRVPSLSPSFAFGISARGIDAVLSLDKQKFQVNGSILTTSKTLD